MIKIKIFEYQKIENLIKKTNRRENQSKRTLIKERKVRNLGEKS